LQTGLAQLVAAELLYQRGRLPRARYLFKHALTQDAAYASLLKSTRQQVHQQVAQVLETQFPALVETQPELVAQHYTAAGCTEQAVHYWQRAGQQASDRSAHLEAIRHLTTGIELLTTLPETPERTQHAVTLYIALGAAMQMAKGQAAPEAEHAYSQLVGSRSLSPPGRLAPAADGDATGGGGSLVAASPGRRQPPGSEIPGAAGCHESGPALAAAG
jgi:predicted ATPase